MSLCIHSPLYVYSFIDKIFTDSSRLFFNTLPVLISVSSSTQPRTSYPHASSLSPFTPPSSPPSTSPSSLSLFFSLPDVSYFVRPDIRRIVKTSFRLILNFLDPFSSPFSHSHSLTYSHPLALLTTHTLPTPHLMP